MRCAPPSPRTAQRDARPWPWSPPAVASTPARSIRCDLRHAQNLAELIRGTARLELLAPVELSAVCFRYRSGAPGAAADRLNAAILRRVIERGRVYLSNATLRGRFALRACFVNHRTTDRDVGQIVPEVLDAARECLNS